MYILLGLLIFQLWKWRRRTELNEYTSATTKTWRKRNKRATKYIKVRTRNGKWRRCERSGSSVSRRLAAAAATLEWVSQGRGVVASGDGDRTNTTSCTIIGHDYNTVYLRMCSHNARHHVNNNIYIYIWKKRNLLYMN